jgi:hypothetical protein
VVYFEDFDSEKLSLDVKNEEAAPCLPGRLNILPQNKTTTKGCPFLPKTLKLENVPKIFPVPKIFSSN